MAKKVKKASSKVTKEDLVAQNEALGEQVAGLQEEVMDLVEENEELNDIFDEQDDYIDELENQGAALLNSLVDEQLRSQALTEELEKAVRVVKGFQKIISAQYEEKAELKHENFHLTIQLAAAKDKLAKYQSVYTDGILKYDWFTVPYQFNAKSTGTCSTSVTPGKAVNLDSQEDADKFFEADKYSNVSTFYKKR